MAKYEDYYRRSTLKKLIYLSLGWLAVLSKIIPKIKGLHVFGSMNGYAIADNSKYLYQQSEDKKYFITKNKSILKELLSDGRFPVYAYSVKGIFLQLFAERSYYTHGIYDLVPPLIWGSEKHNLWHGVPLKDIGPKADWKHNSVGLIKTKIMIYRMISYTYYMACDYVYCPFPDRIDDYKEYFIISRPKIILKRQPRNGFCDPSLPSRKILYAPTYKSMRNDKFDFHSYFNGVGLYDDDFELFLINNSLEFVIRLHPVDNRLMNGVPLPRNVSIDESVDLYESLHKYGLVITDYSSVYFDCLEVKSKCCFVAPDLEDYDNLVGLNKNIFNEIKNNNNAKLLDAIASFY